MKTTLKDLKTAALALGCTIKYYPVLNEYQVYLNEYKNASKKVIDKVSYFCDCPKDALETASRMRKDRSKTFQNTERKFFEKRLTTKGERDRPKERSVNSMWPMMKSGANEKTGKQHNYIINRQTAGTF